MPGGVSREKRQRRNPPWRQRHRAGGLARKRKGRDRVSNALKAKDEMARIGTFHARVEEFQRRAMRSKRD
jgi:hypothetical protein